jgi:4-amino-4-deoxy-L-arabinose transferase-like glycosyltransferase
MASAPVDPAASRRTLQEWRWPLAVAVAGWLAVVLTRSDPGITCDEPFSVLYGKAFVLRLCHRGVDFFRPDSIDETFANRSEHPPFGRWFIGWTHWLLDANRADPDFIDIRSARVAPATAFAVMLALVTHATLARHGSLAGAVAGISLLLMPRVFGHAHFTALDTMMSWTYLMSILSAAWMMRGPRPWLRAPLAGVLLGCALLTKIHGQFLLPLVCVWCLAVYRLRGLVPLGLWLLTGGLVFFAGWPWLWADLATMWHGVSTGGVSDFDQVAPRLSAFLGSSVNRDAIHVSYWGDKFADTEVPWHYPLVMSAVTMPFGLLVLGCVGAVRHWRAASGDPLCWLLYAALLLPIVVFSIPGVPVYDGVRLFLMSFPFWAMLVGVGAGAVARWLEPRLQLRGAAAAISVLVAGQAVGVVYYHPFQLSYYNILVGGLRGAARLGFEVTYWGDTVTPQLVDRWSASAPPRSCAVLVPTLHAGQPFLYATASTQRRSQRIESSLGAACGYVIVYNRRPYLDDVRELIDDPGQTPLWEVVRDGVWLTRVYPRKPTEPPPESKGVVTNGRSGESNTDAL